MDKAFQRIVIFGRQRAGTKGFRQTLETLQRFLESRQLAIFIEEETAQHMGESTYPTINLCELKNQCDLVVVIGGDGSLLTAARQAVEFDTPVLGINRGRLGFLTDIAPQDIETSLGAILDGKYIEERRFLLKAHVEQEGQTLFVGDALNDVVLLPGNFAHMIEFEIFINDQLVCNQRADGLIVATPTGSTAYALSGGGPILHPSLEAIVLVPMFPHTLSSRPIVVSSDSDIHLRISKNNHEGACISADGHEKTFIQPGTQVNITKKDKALRLIHPLNYNYYETLRSKLGWETRG